MTDSERSSRSPAWDDTFLSVAYKMQVSSLRDFGAHDAFPFRRLKSTVNKVSSLRDFSLAALTGFKTCQGLAFKKIVKIIAE